MKITFRTSAHVEDTMVFERLFEESLRLTQEEKNEIIPNGTAVWMFVDGQLAGETYGITPAALYDETGEVVEDCAPGDDSSIYCYSTAILPRFQGLRLAPILMAHFAGLLRGQGRETLIGHATTPAMKSLREMFGASFGATHANWYGTQRTAWFYEQSL